MRRIMNCLQSNQPLTTDSCFLVRRRALRREVAAVAQHGLAVVYVAGGQGVQAGMQHVAEQWRREVLTCLVPPGSNLKPRIVETCPSAAVGRDHKQPRPLLEEATALAVHERHHPLYAHARCEWRG